MSVNISIVKSQNNKATVVTLGDMEILFSYETVVAFREFRGSWMVSENVWGPTTGRHIMGETMTAPADRIPRADFLALVEERFAKF